MSEQAIKRLRELLEKNAFDDECGGFVAAYGEDLLLALEWRPIETAPRDATKVWAYLPEFDEQCVLRYVQLEEWSGWLYVDSILNDCLDCELEPSHWMPLPAPPEDPRYTLTDLGRAYRAAMQRGAKLNGGVKAGEEEPNG